MHSSLDTNILLRYILNDVPHQRAQAVRLLDDQSQTFRICAPVIAEIIFNLQKAGATRTEIADALAQLFSLKNIQVESVITDQVLPFFREHSALSFVDCYAAFLADVSSAEPLWTFDRKLANQHPSAKRLS